MSDLPPPLTPPDCDLRAYDWFPFFHKRLRQSAFWRRSSDQACRISVDLWSEAYEQVPAASLPNDDHLLAEWAGFGRRGLGAWLAIKNEVLSPWVLCSDNRWYHPVLAEVACKAWVDRRLHFWSRECDRLRKENKLREKAGDPPLDLPSKPSNDPFNGQFSSGNCDLSGGKNSPSAGKLVNGNGIPSENALIVDSREKIESFSLRSKDTHASAEASAKASRSKAARPPRKHPYPPDAFSRWYEKYPHKVGRAAAEKAFAKVRTSDAVEFQALLDGVKDYKRLKPPDREWCNPATWLNQARWEDQPATAHAPNGHSEDGEPRIELAGGITAKISTVRDVWGRGRWPADWGPRPGQPGCRIPPETIATIMEAA